MQFRSVNWVVESDIKKCFDTIDHHILIKILRKKIHCKITLSLIESALRAGYLDNIGNHAVANEIGTPQRSVLSPLLCNIYLHEMDTFIQEWATSYNKGAKRKQKIDSCRSLRLRAKFTPGSKEWKTQRKGTSPSTIHRDSD
jgi:retron-type reverse transcriptase